MIPYFYRRFANGGLEEDLLRADAHLKRFLSLITSKDDSVEVQFKVEAGSPVEAYFWDSKQERWRPNGNSPLNWTKAALALALKRGRLRPPPSFNVLLVSEIIVEFAEVYVASKSRGAPRLFAKDISSTAT